jgi:hypothetical protein
MEIIDGLLAQNEGTQRETERENAEANVKDQQVAVSSAPRKAADPRRAEQRDAADSQHARDDASTDYKKARVYASLFWSEVEA